VKKLIVPMPTLSGSMEHGTVLAWRVAAGDIVAVGQVIAEIETDKSVMEYESPEAGRVLGLLAIAGGERVRVGEPILELSPEDTGHNAAAAVVPALRAATAAPSIDAPALRPLSAVRSAIASRVSEAKRTIPHFYVSRELHMDALAQERSGRKERGQPVPSVTALFVKAAALALRAHPALNVQYRDEGLLPLASIDIGLAIATDEGVFIPVLRTVDVQSAAQIDSEVTRLRTAAQRRSLVPGDFAGGAISVSNLGTHGVDSFAGIINPPQVMLLATGTLAPRAVVVEGKVAVAYTMQCVVSCDHRALDGVHVAQFLTTLQALLCEPALLIA
jgi:pyruvate dehydrogenase E2 component (dihydrolipoamide acetyltransferase)